MKFFYCGALLLSSFLAAPASAHSAAPVPTTPVVATRPAVRPLMRYLVATLQLPKARARAVQQALQAHPLQVRTPEQIAERLHAALLPQEYDRFQSLAGSAITYENLRALSVR